MRKIKKKFGEGTEGVVEEEEDESEEEVEEAPTQVEQKKIKAKTQPAA